MKKPDFRRRQIVRAIHAALLAALLSSVPARAHFKYDTQAPANQIIVDSPAGSTNTVSGRGTFSGYFEDTGSGTDAITIETGAIIHSTTSIIQIEGGGTVRNRGKLTESASGYTIVPIDVATATTPLTISNSGSIYTVAGNKYFDGSTGLLATATSSAPLTVTNTSSGTLNINGEVGSDGLVANGNGGLVTMENDGIITGSSFVGTPRGIGATNNGAGITITNTNSITQSAYDSIGIGAAVSNEGDISITNSSVAKITANTSSVYGMAEGMTLSSGTGNISVTNAGSISSSGYAVQGMGAIVGGAFTLINTGTISGGGKDTGGEEGGGYGEGVDIIANGDISVKSSSTIEATASGYYNSSFGVSASSSTGSVYLENSGAISSHNSAGAYGSGYGVTAQTSGEGVTLVNSGTISSYNTVGVNYGLNVQTTGSAGSGATGTLINNGTIDINEGFNNVSGIHFSSSLLTAIIENGVKGAINVSASAAVSFGIEIGSTVGKDVVTNEGSVDTNGVGIQDSGSGNVTVNQRSGSLTAGPGYDAILLGTGNNTVNLSGSPTVTGLMDGGATQTGNTLNFTDVTATTAQQTTFQTVSAEAAANPSATYSLTFGTKTYTFKDFKTVNARFE